MRYTPSEREILFKKVIKGLQSGKSLRQILNEKGTPSRTALYNWLDEDANYAERFARASQLGDEVLFEETLEIARNPLEGETAEYGPKGVTIRRGDMLGHRKLLIETIDKVLARRNPRKYGTKIDLTSANEAINLPPIVGMVIKNELNEPDATNELDQTDTAGYSDLL
jgi:hypothetical protein